MRFLTLALAATLLGAARADDAPSVPTHNPTHDHESSESVKAPAEETTVDYFWRKSDEAFHAGDYPRAIGLHKAIVALAPDETESYSVGAWLMWSLGDKQQALDFIAEGLKANPENSEMWDDAAQHYDLQKLAGQAEAAYANAVQFAPKDEDTMMLRRRYAHSAEHAGDWNRALEVWQGLVKEFPNDVVNKNNLARVEKSIADQKAGNAAKVTATALLGALVLPGLLGLSRRRNLA